MSWLAGSFLAQQDASRDAENKRSDSEGDSSERRSWNAASVFLEVLERCHRPVFHTLYYSMQCAQTFLDINTPGQQSTHTHTHTHPVAIINKEQMTQQEVCVRTE